MKGLAITAIAVSVLLVATTLGLALLGIWSDTNQMQFIATAVLCVFLAVPVVAVTWVLWIEAFFGKD